MSVPQQIARTYLALSSADTPFEKEIRLRLGVLCNP